MTYQLVMFTVYNALHIDIIYYIYIKPHIHFVYLLKKLLFFIQLSVMDIKYYNNMDLGIEYYWTYLALNTNW